MKTEKELEKLKPCCKVCGNSMKYYEFEGYYDNFYFWKLDCNCGNDIEFKIDKIKKGFYA